LGKLRFWFRSTGDRTASIRDRFLNIRDAAIPNDDVVMTTTPSDDVVPNYGKGVITYITADMGTDEIKSEHIPQAIADSVTADFHCDRFGHPGTA
jgi:hypothetical protein